MRGGWARAPFVIYYTHFVAKTIVAALVHLSSSLLSSLYTHFSTSTSPSPSPEFDQHFFLVFLFSLATFRLWLPICPILVHPQLPHPHTHIKRKRAKLVTFLEIYIYEINEHNFIYSVYYLKYKANPLPFFGINISLLSISIYIYILLQ